MFTKLLALSLEAVLRARPVMVTRSCLDNISHDDYGYMAMNMVMVMYMVMVLNMAVMVMNIW